jgi:signal transduction histidine kinase
MHEGQQLPPSAYAHGVAVRVSGRIVGTVLMDGRPPPLSRIDSLFLSSTEHALILGALASVAIALALGIVLTRSLTHPVRELTSALHAMAGGELQQTVPVRSRDELGELTAAFNKMSTDLALANTQRRQMTADIAHDLRTPVTVIAGYLEALRDGVLPPSPERFAILFEEARHLQGLIEDLRTLSLADAGELALHLEPIAPHALLERIAATYSHQAEQRGVSLVVAASEHLPSLLVDVARIVQVLDNLVGNALRYTPSGGTITLSAQATPQGTLLRVSDTGEGIKPEALSRIFDRFYRADVARSQSQGESGLGLAIARALVEAHGGTIRAESEPGHGATFAIVMPPPVDSAAS